MTSTGSSRPSKSSIVIADGEPLDLKKDIIYCPAHGSAFDFEGNVMSAPAKAPLEEFPATMEGDLVVVNLKSS